MDLPFTKSCLLLPPWGIGFQWDVFLSVIQRINSIILKDVIREDRNLAMLVR